MIGVGQGGLMRPSKKELHDLLKAAITSIRNGNRMYGLDSKITSDLLELGLAASAAWQYLDHGLVEISPEHYCGKRPPDQAKDKRLNPKHKGLDLYEFEWHSKVFGMTMYTKLAFSGVMLIVFSIHKSRFEGGLRS